MFDKQNGCLIIAYSGAIWAQAINQQFGFAADKALWQVNAGNGYLGQAEGFGAIGAAKVHMLIVVLMLGAGGAAEGKTGGAGIVQYLVQQAAGFKGA